MNPSDSDTNARMLMILPILGIAFTIHSLSSTITSKSSSTVIMNGTSTTTSTTSTNNTNGIAHLLARSNILELQPYRCARDDYSTGILLDANENSYGPPSTIQSNVIQVKNPTEEQPSKDIELERYPDPYQIPLKDRFIQFRGYNNITASNIFVGVGSDEAIDLLMRIFCIPGGSDQICITPPTYGMYKVCAKVNDIPIITVPLTPSFDVQIEQIIDAITPNVKLLFICSPGNPTSKLIPLSDIRALAGHSKIRNNTIVVVDEAYIDFAITPTAVSTSDDSGTGPVYSNSKDVSAVSLINEFPNVVVLQTLSKAFGLAAIRCGFCIGPPDIIQLMNNVKAPYNVNALTSQLAYDALHVPTTQSSVQEHIYDILQQRDVVVQALSNMTFVTKIYPSDANFVLFQLQSHAYEVYKYLADTEGIVTRYRGTELHCTNCIRVTIGTSKENIAFIDALPQAYTAVTSSSLTAS